MTNAALKESALSKGDSEFDPKVNRIDHRALVAQGIDRVPTQHMGATCSRMMARGVPCDRGQMVAKAIDRVEKINFTTATLNRQFPQPKTPIAKMYLKAMRSISTRLGIPRKDGEPKTMQEVLQDVERLLKNSQLIADDLFRIQLETLKIEANTARIAAGMSESEFQREMRAFAELGRIAKAKADAQAVGASSTVANRPPTGAPPIPKFPSPFPAGRGLDTNLNADGFVPSRVVVSKPVIPKRHLQNRK